MLEEIITSKATLTAIPVFFIAIFIETILVRFFKFKGTNGVKDDLVSIFIGLVSHLANGAAAFLTIGMLVWFQQYQITALPLTIGTFLLCFFLDDLRFYLHHRIAHRVRWGWAMHVTHHSSTRYSMAVALRQGWTKHFSGTTILKVPLVLIGFDPVLVLFCGALNAIYQFFLHTEMIHKLPNWFEAIFNTPSHHRVHHARNPKYLDMNYAGTFIIWDRMFGSFTAEDLEDIPDFGLVKNLETFNPLHIIFHEYWSMLKDVFGSNRTLLDRLLYIIAPPGWSHDGSRMTSIQIKQAESLVVVPVKTD